MTREEFISFVTDFIVEELPRDIKLGDVKTEKFSKTNSFYTGLYVKKDDWISPILDLDELYDAYLEHGYGEGGLEEMLVEMGEFLLSPRPNIDISILDDYEKIKNKLFIRVCNIESANEFLNSVPYTQISNLAITYHVLLSNEANSVTTTAVDHKMLDNFGINKKQLHEAAISNSAKLMPPLLCDIGECKLGLHEPYNFLDDNVAALLSPPPILCLTNQDRTHGAAVIFYPNVLDKAANCTGGGCYILPSSVHELMLIADNREVSIEMLKDMVFMGNSNIDITETDDVLSFNVYHYDTKDKIFETADEFKKRQRNKLLEPPKFTPIQYKSINCVSKKCADYSVDK